MSEAISRGTKAGMRRWYYMSVPRCSFVGCRTYLVRSEFRTMRRCAKHSTECVACDGKGYQLKASGDPKHPISGTVPCSICRSAGRLPRDR